MEEKPKRHLFQIRRKEPRSGKRDPFYTPERDIAQIGPGIARGAMISLEECHWEPWLREYMDKNGISYQDLLDTKAPLMFAKALTRIIQAEHPVAALEAEGFTELPHPIQMLFYTRLGQVFLCGVFAGVKDISQEDDAPPATIQGLLDDVNEVFGEFIDGPQDSDDT